MKTNVSESKNNCIYKKQNENEIESPLFVYLKKKFEKLFFHSSLICRLIKSKTTT